MTIPERLQIFGKRVDVSRSDAFRLTPHLASWRKLNRLFKDGVDDTTLRKLLVLELLREQPRGDILDRLIGALSSKEKDHLAQQIQSIVSHDTRKEA